MSSQAANNSATTSSAPSSSSYSINMEILKCIEENELNQMIEDASNCLAGLEEGNTKFGVLRNAYKDAAKDLAKSLWTSIELAFTNFAKEKCHIFVPRERLNEFRRMAFPHKEYQGLNLMLERLEEFYFHQSRQSANEFDHYFDITRQLIRNIKSTPPPDAALLARLKQRFKLSYPINDENSMEDEEN